MEIDVGGGGEQGVVMERVIETVEVVASGDDVPIPSVHVSSRVGGLMARHMIVANPEGILVPTSEVSSAGESGGEGCGPTH